MPKSCSTLTTTNSIDLLLPPLKQSRIVCPPSTYVVDIQQVEIPQALTGYMTLAPARNYSWKHTKSILTADQAHLDKAQKCYKANFEKDIWFRLQCSLGDYVHLDWPPNWNWKAKAVLPELFTYCSGSYCVLISYNHTINIKRYGLEDTGSINCISIWLRPLIAAHIPNSLQCTAATSVLVAFYLPMVQPSLQNDQFGYSSSWPTKKAPCKIFAVAPDN